MEKVIQAITTVNDKINSVVWGIPMLILIICTGLYLSVRMGCFQLRRSRHIGKHTFLSIFNNKQVTKSSEKKSISQFQALSTALAGTIGTGNIAGVATALASGGPGAVFWMWISAIFGMMTKFSENVLGIYYRKKNENGEWVGGPMYYLTNGVKNKKYIGKLGKPLAILFAVFCIFASFGIGNMAQINSISSSMKVSFHVPTIVTGVVLATITALVIIGGIQRIGKVTEKLVPFMAVIYITGTLVVLVTNFRQIPYVFGSIFHSAFSFNAVIGGVAGSAVKMAITMGFKRGVFSNEAGLGSSVLVNTASDIKEPVRQGMWGIFEVFTDTIVVCTLTAFTLLSSTVHSQDSITLEEALQNISTTPQYVQLSAKDGINQVPLLVDKDSHGLYECLDENTDEEYELYDVKTTTGEEFKIKLKKRFVSNDNDDYIYTNIMSVKGTTQTVDGKKVITGVQFEKLDGVPLVTYAFEKQFGSYAGKILAVLILMFAYSTVLGWSFYGTRAVEYLFGNKATKIYKVVFILVVVFGATMSIDLVWELSDTFNGLMVIPNLIGVLALSGVVVKITKNYVDRNILGKKDVKPMLSAYVDIQAEQEKNL